MGGPGDLFRQDMMGQFTLIPSKLIQMQGVPAEKLAQVILVNSVMRACERAGKWTLALWLLREALTSVSSGCYVGVCENKGPLVYTPK